MDKALDSGLKHIDAAYFVATKLVEAKMAPHQIGMACLTYDREVMRVCVGGGGKSVSVYVDNRSYPTKFDVIDIDGIVEKCKKLGFTSGSVTEDQLKEHRKIVERGWSELCASLSTLKTGFTYDAYDFLRLNYTIDFQRWLNLCFHNDKACTTAQIFGPFKTYRVEPKEAATTLRILHQIPVKEEGEK